MRRVMGYYPSCLLSNPHASQTILLDLPNPQLLDSFVLISVPPQRGHFPLLEPKLSSRSESSSSSSMSSVKRLTTLGRVSLGPKLLSSVSKSWASTVCSFCSYCPIFQNMKDCPPCSRSG